MDEKVKKIIKLGVMANGGDVHRKDWCQYDPSTGYSLCEYCAIFRALNEANKLLCLLDKKEREMKQLTKERDLAIAHDTQPYPTAYAYEQACKVLQEKEKEIEELKSCLDSKERIIEGYIDNRAELDNRIKDLEQGIGEVLDGTLPFLAEQRLKKLIEKKGDT